MNFVCPQQFSAGVYRSNFPHDFSAAIFRSSFPQQFFPQEFSAAFSAWILGIRHNFHEMQ
jgi:hypothetical protein